MNDIWLQLSKTFLRFDRFLFIALFVVYATVHAQTSDKFAVQIQVSVTKPTVLTWAGDLRPALFIVRQRTSPDQPFVAVDTIDPDVEARSFTPADAAWIEIEIEKRTTNDKNEPLAVKGYWQGRNDTSMDTWRVPGRVLLIVDEYAMARMIDHVNAWSNDAQCEGWIVETLTLPTGKSVADVKQEIRNSYMKVHPVPLTHVFLVGDVPYPYSGGFSSKGANVSPDGHAEHGGAWTADCYYGDLVKSGNLSSEEDWTDETVNIFESQTASRPGNRNTPGDGKFDQSYIPTDIELAVGRLDLSDLPTFSTSVDDRSREIQLLQAYFDRDHKYRMNELSYRKMGVVDDNFGSATFRSGDSVRVDEAYAASAWRGFSTVVGDSVIVGDYHFDTTTQRFSIAKNPVLLGYGCGHGGNNHCDFVANMDELAREPMYCLFNWWFGSYFVDHDQPDNLMRGLLANDGYALTIGWNGRPHWPIHVLGARYTMGELARATINNDGTYLGASYTRLASRQTLPYTYGNRGIHLALLGDPTLRMPATVMSGSLRVKVMENGSKRIAWSAQDDVEQYIVESGVTLDEPMVVRGIVDNDVASGEELHISLGVADGSLVRIRPIGRKTMQSYTPEVGRGLIASTLITSILDDGIDSESGEVARYDLLGRQLSTIDVPIMYISVRNDGSARLCVTR